MSIGRKKHNFGVINKMTAKWKLTKHVTRSDEINIQPPEEKGVMYWTPIKMTQSESKLAKPLPTGVEFYTEFYILWQGIE